MILTPAINNEVPEAEALGRGQWVLLVKVAFIRIRLVIKNNMDLDRNKDKRNHLAFLEWSLVVVQLMHRIEMQKWDQTQQLTD